VDDNCDGKIDCADPQCTQTGGPNGTGQWSCATLPSGTVNGVSWSIVAFDQASSSLACPENYSGAKADYYSNAAFSSYGCQCDCSNTTPAYCKGDWCYTVDTTSCPTTSNATCVGFTTQANPSQSCNQVTAQNIADNWNFLGGPQGVVTVAGVCGATPAAQSTPAPTYDTGAACSLPQAGTGCGGSSAVCVPVASQGFATCSIAAGSVSCPDSLTAFTVYADAPTETHSCSSCSCSGNPNLSCDAWAAAYMQNTDCNGATAECDPPAGSSPAPFAYKASTCTSSGTYGCSGGADCMKSFCVAVNTTGSPTSCTANNTPSATGSVTHQGQEYTVCCP
jgi:hypothetical protein